MDARTAVHPVHSGSTGKPKVLHTQAGYLLTPTRPSVDIRYQGRDTFWCTAISAGHRPHIYRLRPLAAAPPASCLRCANYPHPIVLGYAEKYSHYFYTAPTASVPSWWKGRLAQQARLSSLRILARSRTINPEADWYYNVIARANAR